MIKLAWKNIIHNPLNLLIGLVLFALGIGLITYLLLLNTQLQEKFEANLADIDLVIGAKGSPLQLILCGMYHIDNPTGNIKIKDAKAFLNPKHPLVKTAVPLSLGDNYKKYRIVGTTPQMLDLYKAKVVGGRMFEKELEVILGAQVADATGLKLGDSFTSSHGFVEDENLAHDHSAFKVVGLMGGTGSVIDQLILTPTSSIWSVHKHEDNPKPSEEEHEEHDHTHTSMSREVNHPVHIHDNSNADLLFHVQEEITSLLIQYRSKTNFQSLSMPRNINENTNLQAAAPAYEINKLRDMVGIGTDGIKVIAWLIALVSAFSIFISLFRSMKERKYELALMRVLGANHTKLFFLVIAEGLLLALLGWIIGTILAHIGIYITGQYLMEDFRYSFSGSKFLLAELGILAVSLLIGFIAAVIPAWQASRTDINTTLVK